jgi:hypothetical protein
VFAGALRLGRAVFRQTTMGQALPAWRGNCRAACAIHASPFRHLHRPEPGGWGWCRMSPSPSRLALAAGRDEPLDAALRLNRKTTITDEKWACSVPSLVVISPTCKPIPSLGSGLGPRNERLVTPGRTGRAELESVFVNHRSLWNGAALAAARRHRR